MDQQSIIRTRDEMQRSAIKRVEPEEPSLAKAVGLRASVFVGVDVDEKGDVTSARILQGHSMLKDAALQAALQWKFRPLRLNGSAVRFRGTVIFGFGPEGPILVERELALSRREVQTTPNSSLAHYSLGKAYYDGRRYEEAVEEFKKAINLEPDFAMAHFSLGEAYSLLPRYREAIEAYKHAIRIKPDLMEAYYFLGTAYEYAYQGELAIQVFKQLLDGKLDLDIAEHAYGRLATIYESLGRIEEAAHAYERLIDVKKQCMAYDPESHRSPHGFAYIVAKMYTKLGRNEEAIKAFQQVVSLAPNSPTEAVNAYLEIAAIYQKTGRDNQANEVSAEALEIAKRAVKSSASSGRAHYDLGRVYDQIGKRTEAMAEYKKAVGLVPDWAQPHVRLAQLYEKMGDNESAYKEYVIVKRLDQQEARQLADILEILKKTEKK